MKRALAFVATFGLGFLLAFLMTQWRVGATEAFEALDRCTNQKNGWFKR